MLNSKELILNTMVTMVLIVITILALIQVAYMEHLEKDIYDQWLSVNEYERVSSLRDFLFQNDWIQEDVPIDELDYILVLVNQCSNEFFSNVPTSLVLAVISMESSFQKDLIGFNEDTGLMQVIPKYHRDRIQKYIYDENVDLTDPRLNVMVGMDYLEELLEWANGNVQLAVMAYNNGPDNAKRLYDNWWRSTYSERVLERAYLIEEFLEGGGDFVCNGS